MRISINHFWQLNRVTSAPVRSLSNKTTSSRARAQLYFSFSFFSRTNFGESRVTVLVYTPTTARLWRAFYPWRRRKNRKRRRVAENRAGKITMPPSRTSGVFSNAGKFFRRSGARNRTPVRVHAFPLLALSLSRAWIAGVRLLCHVLLILKNERIFWILGWRWLIVFAFN